MVNVSITYEKVLSDRTLILKLIRVVFRVIRRHDDFETMIPLHYLYIIKNEGCALTVSFENVVRPHLIFTLRQLLLICHSFEKSFLGQLKKQ
jgi:hypothetical protein